MITIRDFHHAPLSIPAWDINPGDAWCVIGPNGAGKQFIDQALLGKLTGGADSTVEFSIDPKAIQLVSFEAQQAIFERELKLAATDLLPESETATRAADFLPSEQLDNTLLDTLNLRHRLDSNYTQLSTGESRKLLIARAILTGAELLIVDNPFDSLDQDACTQLSQAFNAVAAGGTTLVLLLSNRSDIPNWCTRLATLSKGTLQPLQGQSREAVDAALGALFAPPRQPEWPEQAQQLADFGQQHIVEIQDATVRYGEKTVLDGLSLSIHPLEHTLITGENGAGKSTLLGLITGDNPQCYSNKVKVLGFTRGQGESVWELKQQMGIVSSDLHRMYRVRCDVLAAVCSGFFDSIGVYDRVNELQARIASQWLAAAGLGGREQDRFSSLSYGEQRLTLIARALVKSPLLLVLDEPTQGLDELNRGRVMNLLETLEARQHTTLIFVSHRQDEYLPMFRQHLHLKIPV